MKGESCHNYGGLWVWRKCCFLCFVRMRLGRSREGKWERTLQKPWGSDCTEKITSCVKIRKVRQGMLSLGLVSSIPALGDSRGLGCESCSAQDLMHWFCPYYKLFLLFNLRLHLREEQRLFSVFRNRKVSSRSIDKRNLLFACLESVETNI